jgi:hypothetical protein
MCIALATIMLVWFGVQESLASSHGGQGFHMGKFLSFFMLITFAYTLVRFYDSSIPGVGQSFRGFINGGAQYLVSVIGSDSITSIQNTLNQAQATSGPGMMKALMNPYYAIVRHHSSPDCHFLRRGLRHRGLWSNRQRSRWPPRPTFIPFLVLTSWSFCSGMAPAFIALFIRCSPPS